MPEHQRKQYSITGIGVIGRFGAGVEDLNKALQSFDADLPSSSLPDSERTETIPRVNTDFINNFLPPHKLRRTDHFSKLAISALFLALENGGLKPEECQDSSVIVASGYGPVASTCSFKETFFNSGPLGASPLMFTKSVQNQTAAHIAMLLNTHGSVSTVCQHSLPFQHALLQACSLLDEKKTERVLIGCVDEYTEFLDYCRRRYETELPYGHRQGQRNRFSKFPGEGACFFILENSETGKEKFLIESPTLSRHSENDTIKKTPKSDSEKLAIKKQRSIYGEFPTSAAFDLVAATFALGSDQHIITETGINGLTARICIMKNSSMV